MCPISKNARSTLICVMPISHSISIIGCTIQNDFQICRWSLEAVWRCSARSSSISPRRARLRSGIRARPSRVAHQQMTSLSQTYTCKHTKMTLACTWKHAKARPTHAHGNMRERVTVVRMHTRHFFRSESEPTATPHARSQSHSAQRTASENNNIESTAASKLA